jgi:AcrR family transcriptional regulator
MATRTMHPDRTRQRELRREELLDAADRIVRSRGRDTSMDEIAAEAGITKPILYRHFGDKDGLYEALAERYVEELKEALLPAGKARGARDRLAATIDAYLAYVEREPERYRFLLGAAERSSTAELMADFRRERVERCADTATANLRRVGIEGPVGELWAHAVSGLIREAGIWWLETRAMPRKRVVEHLTAVVWEGGGALPKAQQKTP